MSPLRFAPEYQEGGLHEFPAGKEREARSSEEIEDYVCFCFETQKLICENKAQGLNKWDSPEKIQQRGQQESLVRSRPEWW